MEGGGTHMIVVHATFDIKKGYLDKIIEMARECLEKTPLEEGNLKYTLLKGIGDETTLMYVEEWADEEAFQAHLNMPYYRAFVEARAPYFNAPVKVKKFRAEEI